MPELNKRSTKLVIADTDQNFISWVNEALNSKYDIQVAHTMKELQHNCLTDDLDILLVSETFPELCPKSLLDRLFSLKKYPWVFTVKIIENEENGKTTKAMKEGFHFVISKTISKFQLKACLTSLQKLRFLSNRAMKLIDQYRGKAEKDPLTSLYNRTVFLDHSEKEFSRTQRNGLPITVLMIDIDDFKGINDSQGHLAGDYIIVELAKILKKNLRKYDILARFGGDEFIVSLPHTGSAQAKKVADKLQESIRKTTFTFSEVPIPVTLSIGSATYCHKNCKLNLNHLISHADEALYEAKNTGRNKVCIYEESS